MSGTLKETYVAYEPDNAIAPELYLSLIHI